MSDVLAQLRARRDHRRAMQEWKSEAYRADAKVVARCGQKGCGRQLAKVVELEPGPLYWAHIEPRKYDATEPPPWEADAKLSVAYEALERMGWELNEESALFIVQATYNGLRDPEELDEWESERALERWEEDLKSYFLLDWLLAPPGAWRPTLYARCVRHPRTLTLDRDELIVAWREATRRRKRSTIVPV